MSSAGPIETKIRECLQKLSPKHLEVVNESYMHNVPKGEQLLISQLTAVAIKRQFF